MASASLDYSIQPYSGTDLVAWVGLSGAIVPRAWVHGLTAIV